MHLAFYNACSSCHSNDTYANIVTWDCTCMPITRASPNMLAGSVLAGGEWVDIGGCDDVDGGGGVLSVVLCNGLHTSTRVCHTSRTTRHHATISRHSKPPFVTTTHHPSSLVITSSQPSQDNMHVLRGCVGRARVVGIESSQLPRATCLDLPACTCLPKVPAAPL